MNLKKSQSSTGKCVVPIINRDYATYAQKMFEDVVRITEASSNEATLRHEIEKQEDGIPLAHPKHLSDIVGPASSFGSNLIPLFFDAIESANRRDTSKTLLLFTEWKRLFGQVVGIQSDSLRTLLKGQRLVHQRAYESNVSAYFFALNTYIALIVKLVAALSLSNTSQDIARNTIPIEQRIHALESGELFLGAGVSNMLSGDFFSWYYDDIHWKLFSSHIDSMIQRLSMINFDVTKKSPDSTRDLFKGIYQTFVPRAVRHALGEFYTPDWLAAHALDTMNWSPEHGLMDPTCGSGTFLLEALGRRLKVKEKQQTAKDLLQNLYGIDLNPLAVLAAKGSLVVYLAPYLDPYNPVRLPIFLADAINPSNSRNGIYYHDLQTERGVKSFEVPETLINNQDFFAVFNDIRSLIEENHDAKAILNYMKTHFNLNFLSVAETDSLRRTIETLVDLHKGNWNGIWCSIIADRFAAGAIPPLQFICGNPPWVKWSHLPPEYAKFVKLRCIELGVFSGDRWVGGIESDISTVITYEVIDKWLANNGRLGFFITGSVFTTESSAGFRRFELEKKAIPFRVDLIEDFKEIAPFEDVSNHATFMTLTKNHTTQYPITYRYWKPASPRSDFSSAEEFRTHATVKNLLANPVSGIEGSPWLKGTQEEHELWKDIFAPGKRYYLARKGVTTDRNGIFWVHVHSVSPDRETCSIQNAAEIGRTKDIASISQIVETEHIFPLLRGRGVSAFRALPEQNLRIIVPQRGMHGDPNLPITHRRTYQFLSHFQSELEKRSSWRKFQRNHPYWSLWSTGAYTFFSYKVLWKEMSGSRFAAAYIGPFPDPLLGPKIVIPDHKLYFVPFDTEEEAAYLTGFLNASIVAKAISAYASQLSLGISVVEYLHIPKFDPDKTSHMQLVSLSKSLTKSNKITSDEYNNLDDLVRKITDV
jgi:hypothetical protein